MDFRFLIAHVLLFSEFLFIYLGLPRCCCGKEPVCQCRRYRFSFWVGKIPWRRKWQLTPVFLPGECRGQEPGGPQSAEESDMTERNTVETCLLGCAGSSSLRASFLWLWRAGAARCDGSSCGAQALEHAGFSSCVVGSAVAPGGLQSTVPTGNGLSHSAACGALPDQGLDECPLPWQVDSYPLYHQGSLLSLVNSLWGTCNLFPKPIQVALLDKV